ncbi:PEP-CTERM sorting domain-containing protein [Aquisalimonas sp.]|uniref:PEP-CTERM sorting domain-containing protein n=1 Tax=Aquisalimonas sp. TaxID=1872621 RepID=UPI0025C68F36|nr:PEP-CTERM sorting domain-containing protein [Aquisalimonas sp.]
MRKIVVRAVMGVLVCVGLGLAPLASAAVSHLSLTDSEMERERNAINAMFGRESDEVASSDGAFVNDPNSSFVSVSESNTPTRVPEPGMLMLFAVGGLGLYYAAKGGARA